VQSIENQDDGGGVDAYEIIIVDDGSTDGGGDIVAEMAKSNPRIRLICQQNAGCGHARNVGMKIAQGKYIYFIDADDIVVTNSVYPVIKEMERLNLEAMHVVADIVRDGDDAETVASTRNKNGAISTSDVIEGIEFLRDTNLMRKIGATVWRNIYKRETIEQHNLSFVDFNAEDYVFNLNFMTLAKRVAVCNQRTYVYVSYPNSTCHFHHSYDYYYDLGHRWLQCYDDWHNKWCDKLLALEMTDLALASRSLAVFNFLIWPQLRECISPKLAFKVNRKLKRNGLYPLDKPSNYDDTNYSDNKILRRIWNVSRCYPMWMTLLFFNWLIRSKLRNDAHRRVKR
jgi:glycosyltransferase involved in cell wall biosynthesis